MELYDLAGRLVRVLVSGRQAAGTHQVALSGEGLASGIYLLKLTTPRESRAIKVTLLR
jgi:hypothetical protein